MGDNLIEPSRVTIAGCYVTLGRCFVAVSTPWGYECGEVGIILVEGNAVVANLAVKYGLLCVTGCRAGLMEGALCVVGFSCGVKVKPWKSTVRLGWPFFFAQMTMRWHHVTDSPTGTGSITPSKTSWSSPVLTSSCQWSGTSIRV